MGYKAVIFDLDGTLLDTLEDLADSMNRILHNRGLPTHPTEAFRRENNGNWNKKTKPYSCEKPAPLK